jgi:hypothetical protein
MNKTPSDEKGKQRLLRSFAAQKRRVKASHDKLKKLLDEADRKLRSGPK